MTLIQDFIPKGRKNRPGHGNPCNYITIHNTGNTSTGAGAKNHAVYIKGDAAANLPASWHITVDDKEAIQHLPFNESAFHAGDGGTGTGNRQSIGIEICMNGDLLKATDNAAAITASLCEQYKIPIENVVQHNKWSGKNCPQMLRAGKPYSWEVFIAKVQGMINVFPLKRGEKGDKITELQSALNKLLGSGLVVDGSFGPATEAAVKIFQDVERLTANGIVCETTWAALERAVKYNNDFDPPEVYTRAQYQGLIQAVCNFSDPAGVWAVLNTHRFADDLYRKWAESYN